MKLNRILIWALLSFFGSQVFAQETDDNFIRDLDQLVEYLQEIEISAKPNKEVYVQGEEIIISYTLLNKSKDTKKLYTKHYMGHPFSTGISVINEEDTSIVKNPSRHILSSQIYSAEQMETFKSEILPSKSHSASLKLRDVPVYKKGIDSRYLPIGTYRIRFHYFIRQSKEFIIKVIQQ